MKIQSPIWIFWIIWWSLPCSAFSQQFSLDTIPNVDFAIVRVDYLTKIPKRVYEFSQSFRKCLPARDFSTKGDVFFKCVPAGDFGYTEVQSRLTGQRLVHASTVWAGSGRLEYPRDSLFTSSLLYGPSNPPPDTLLFVSIFGGTKEDADTVWNNVRDLDCIHRLSSRGKYEVVLFDHFYSVGGGDPRTAEWFVIAFTRPPAPVDVGLTNLAWPKKYLTRNVGGNAEVEVHNFGDQTIAATVDCELSNPSGGILRTASEDRILPADSSTIVSFPYKVTSNLDSVRFHLTLKMSDNATWHDAFPDNDSWDRFVRLTTQPLFRPISSISRPGRVPVRGELLDFDGDGRFDVFEYGFAPKLWHATAKDGFTDVTGNLSMALPPHPRLAIAADFTGDGKPDLLINYFALPTILLKGDGKSGFEDFSSASGVDRYMGSGEAAVIDLENVGHKDLILGSYTQEIVLRNDGSGHFTDVTAQSNIVDPGQTSSVACGDVNNDGYSDIVLTNWGSPPKLFLNNGHGLFSFIQGPWSFTYGRMSVLSDIDGDGFKDIIFSRGSFEDETLIFKNKGNGAFDDATDTLCKIKKSFYCDAEDINGDRKPDLVLDNLGGFTFLLNAGGKFTEHNELLVGMEDEIKLGALGASARPRFVDIDGDGFIDIYSQQVVFHNEGFDGDMTRIAEYPGVSPNSFALLQNYPNPFNPSTMVEYSLPARSHVRLQIFNILGQRVTTLYDGEQTAGHQKVLWNANVSSGIYFYRIEAIAVDDPTNHFVDTKKMLLLR